MIRRPASVPSSPRRPVFVLVIPTSSCRDARSVRPSPSSPHRPVGTHDLCVRPRQSETSSRSFDNGRSDRASLQDSVTASVKWECVRCRTRVTASSRWFGDRRPPARHFRDSLQGDVTTDATIIQSWLHIKTRLCRGKVISTWIFRNLHVENKKFFGGMK